MPLDNNIAQQIITQIPESIKLLFDLTARMDERLKILIQDTTNIHKDLKEMNNYMDSKIEEKMRFFTQELTDTRKEMKEFEDHLNKTDYERISKIEQRLSAIDTFKSSTEDRWKMIFDATWKLIITVVGAYLIYKLGIK
jgi:predicted nuclease with TOPRIM domain